jgi:hypothetical protein
MKNNNYTYKYNKEEKALLICDVSGSIVFKVGNLVRVYKTFFSKREPNDVDFANYTDFIIEKLESYMSTDYYISFYGRNINNKNNNTNYGNYLNISKPCQEMRYVKLLKANQLELNLL